MPIRIPNGLPAEERLRDENIFVMNENRASSQEIRPLEIAILNLMPNKAETETQLLRLLSNTPLQANIELVTLDTHKPKNTTEEYLLKFYQPFSKIRHKKYDGFIITGAPVELLDFEEVDYWNELRDIMDWSTTNVFSTLHICWGAQAALYHHYGINKKMLSQKMFGVFPHIVLDKRKMLLRGFDDSFFAPHSRWTTIDESEIISSPKLELLATSPIAGAHIVKSKNSKQFFVFGHMEYDANTLANEYSRDLGKGEKIEVPYNYFPNDNPQNKPKKVWRSHANLLFSNWLNYHVYQETPYVISQI